MNSWKTSGIGSFAESFRLFDISVLSHSIPLHFIQLVSLEAPAIKTMLSMYNMIHILVTQPLLIGIAAGGGSDGVT